MVLLVSLGQRQVLSEMSVLCILDSWRPVRPSRETTLVLPSLWPPDLLPRQLPGRLEPLAPQVCSASNSGIHLGQ